MRIIVSGLVGLYPVGGVAWDYMQYIVGLSRLGHDVYYHEDTWSWPYHPLRRTYTSDGTYSAKFINDFFTRYAAELSGKWHYHHLHDKSFGMDRIAFDNVAKNADLFLNISGASIIPESLSPRCLKVFLDTDPGYNQIIFSECPAWSENVERWCDSVSSHDKFFTYAENIHNNDCTIPKLGFEWNTTRMPVVVDLWKFSTNSKSSFYFPWTTVMSWNVFKGKLSYMGKEYYSKDVEFKKFITIPQLSPEKFKIGIGGKAPIEELKRNGWTVIDGAELTSTPENYQNFIFSSKGEISIAKNVYVAMKTGWFSCRSVCYMAAGKPVVLQDTGFSKYIPAGEGVLVFNNLDEAIDAINNVNVDYKKHCKAALDAAKEYFDYTIVLKDMLDKIGIG